MPSQQHVQPLLRVKIAYPDNEHGREWHPIRAKLWRGMKVEHCDRHQNLLVGVQGGSRVELLRHKERSKECPRSVDRATWKLSAHPMASGFTILLRPLNQCIEQLLLFNLPFPDIPVYLLVVSGSREFNDGTSQFLQHLVRRELLRHTPSDLDVCA